METGSREPWTRKPATLGNSVNALSDASSPDASTDVRLEVEAIDQDIGIIRLNRPPVNAADARMYLDLKHAVTDLQSEARVIILTGSGSRVFCGGNDLHEFATMSSESAEHHMRVAREAFWSLIDCSVPLIGAINGAAIGTGLAFAACCDFLVASEHSTFSLPEIRAGVLGGVKFGARLLPEQAVRRMYFLAETLTAGEMVARGASMEVVQSEQLLDRCVSLAETIRGHAPDSVAMAKEAMRAVETMDLKSGYELEQRYTIRLADSPDSKEAVSALLERRAPQFSSNRKDEG